MVNKRGGEKKVKRKQRKKTSSKKAANASYVNLKQIPGSNIHTNNLTVNGSALTSEKIMRKVGTKKRKVNKTTKPKTAKTLRKQEALYGLSQKQFKKELENIGYQFNEVKNAKINKNKNLVYVGSKAYKIFSPLNSNKKYQLKSNNTLNPYKMAINNYNKSVRNTNPIPRTYLTKKNYFNALSAALSDDNNFNKKKLKKKKPKKTSTNKVKKAVKKIEPKVKLNAQRKQLNNTRRALKKNAKIKQNNKVVTKKQANNARQKLRNIMQS
tara:strand:+ start:812 stop:1615 length:804 start_codon:yes stop_codon:yes gene_type:complete